MAVIVETRLAELAREIEFWMRRTAGDIIQIGAMLAEARSICPKGQWYEWLKPTGVTPRMANHWIHVWEQFASVKFTDNQITTSGLIALAAPSTPEGALNEVKRRLDQGEKFTGDQVEAVLDKYRILEGVQVGSAALLKTYGQTETGKPAKVISRSAVTSAATVAEEMLQRGAVEIGGEDHPVPDTHPETMQQPLPDMPPLPNTFRLAVSSQTKLRQGQHIEENTPKVVFETIAILTDIGDPLETPYITFMVTPDVMTDLVAGKEYRLIVQEVK